MIYRVSARARPRKGLKVEPPDTVALAPPNHTMPFWYTRDLVAYLYNFEVVSVAASSVVIDRLFRLNYA